MWQEAENVYTTKVLASLQQLITFPGGWLCDDLNNNNNNNSNEHNTSINNTSIAVELNGADEYEKQEEAGMVCFCASVWCVCGVCAQTNN